MLSYLKDKKIYLGMVLFCLAYLFFQFLYIPYSAYGADEFWFAHHIYQYTKHLPYRDFLPYKTLLGYYLLTPPFYLSHDATTPLFYIRDELAVINTIFLGVVCFWGNRFFKPGAILLTLILLVANHLFLIYSVDIRVDMLTCWLGLFAVLFVLSDRPVLAGLALGISFLISQKALWFWTAMDVALILQWLLFLRNLRGCRFLIMINLTAIFVLGIYLGIASSFSSGHTVFHSVFYEGYTQSKITWYSKIYYQCWQMILSNGPVLIFLWPMTLLSLMVDFPRHSTLCRNRFFIFIFASCMTVLIISYQQPFPYQMVYLMPGFFVLFSDFFSWLHDLLTQKLTCQLTRRPVFWVLFLISLTLLSAIIIFDLPIGYLLILVFPVCLYYFIFPPTHFLSKEILFPLCASALFFIGIFYPLSRFSVIAYNINGSYQKAMVQLIHELLKEDGEFFAGTPLLYQKDEAIDGLKNLIGPAIHYLYHADKKLLPVMISSLYIEPRTSEQVIQELKETPVKLYVNNYRILSLPSTIRKYLYSHYLPYWGSIYIYAPTLAAGKQRIHLPFSGNYQLISFENARISIDHHAIQVNKIMTLSSGFHTSIANFPYRLKFIPHKPSKILSPENQQDKWYLMLKAILV